MSERSTRPAPPVIESVQVMRGIAAFAVVLYHANLILAKPQYGGRDILHSLASRGWLGVNFFFVLSGFIIMVAHHADIGRPRAAGRYIWRRFTRLYPIYWVCLSVYLLAAYLGIGHPEFHWEPANILSAYLLVQVTDNLSLPLQVAWTLFYEVAFYAAFTVLIFNRAAGVALFAVWLAAISIAGLLGYTQMGLLHMWNVSFFTGMAVFALARRLDSRWGLPVLGAGIALLIGLLLAGFGASLRQTQASPLSVLLLTLPFGMILLGAALAEPRFGWRAPKWLLLIGAASYAIYLVHSPVISVIAQLHHKLAGAAGLPGLALFLLATAISTAAGIIAHLVIEQPLLVALRWLGDRFRALTRPRPFEAP